jgi:hypothetical protein
MFISKNIVPVVFAFLLLSGCGGGGGGNSQATTQGTSTTESVSNFTDAEIVDYNNGTVQIRIGSSTLSAKITNTVTDELKLRELLFNLATEIRFEVYDLNGNSFSIVDELNFGETYRIFIFVEVGDNPLTRQIPLFGETLFVMAPSIVVSIPLQLDQFGFNVSGADISAQNSNSPVLSVTTITGEPVNFTDSEGLRVNLNDEFHITFEDGTTQLLSMGYAGVHNYLKNGSIFLQPTASSGIFYASGRTNQFSHLRAVEGFNVSYSNEIVLDFPDEILSFFFIIEKDSRLVIDNTNDSGTIPTVYVSGQIATHNQKVRVGQDVLVTYTNAVDLDTRISINEIEYIYEETYLFEPDFSPDDNIIVDLVTSEPFSTANVAVSLEATDITRDTILIVDGVEFDNIGNETLRGENVLLSRIDPTMTISVNSQHVTPFVITLKVEIVSFVPSALNADLP